MITLIPQLKSELNTLFSSRADDYKNTIIKEAYETMPKGQYPKVTIEEIRNSEIESRSTTKGERTTFLAYQIVSYSRDTSDYDYVSSVRFMTEIIDDYLKSKYPFKRIVKNVIKPYILDSTVMTSTIRYECVYDYETNLIYKN